MENFEDFKTAIEFDPDQQWIAVLDELSSHASGYSADSGEVEKHMRQMVRKAAKTGTRLLALGHDGKDIHPTVREMANDWVVMEREIEGTRPDPEEDTFRGHFYEDMEDREPKGLRWTLDDVPKAPWRYNPSEFTSWAWDSD